MYDRAIPREAGDGVRFMREVCLDELIELSRFQHIGISSVIKAQYETRRIVFN